MIRKIMLVGTMYLAVVGGTRAEEVSLSNDIMPLFERSCAVCHKREGGKEKAIQNNTFYETKEDLLSVVGTFIIPGKPEDSGLIKVLNQTQKFGKREMPMPPPKAAAPKWSAADLKKFADWVSAGAKDS